MAPYAIDPVRLVDINGNPVVIPMSAFGDLRTVELNPIVQLSFEYTVDNTDLTGQDITNEGTITQADGMAVVSTSTTAGSIAHLDSARHTKYRPGFGGLFRGTALFTTPVAGTEQHIGIVDTQGSSVAFENGYTIGYEGTIFGVHRFANDTIETIALADCDDPLDGKGISKMTLDQTKLNVYAIQYQYLGAGAIEYLIESDTTGQLIPFHTIHYTNKNIEPSTHNPNFHLAIHVANGETTSNMTMKSSSMAYFTEGRDPNFQEQEPQHSSGTVKKTEVTDEVAIFTIRVRATYAGKTNYIDILLEHISASIEANSANNLGTIRLVKNAELGGTPSWADINTTDSIVELDTAGTTVTGGEEFFPIQLAGKNDRIAEPLRELNMGFKPGDTVTLAGFSENEATIKGSLLWKELF